MPLKLLEETSKGEECWRQIEDGIDPEKALLLALKLVKCQAPWKNVGGIAPCRLLDKSTVRMLLEGKEDSSFPERRLWLKSRTSRLFKDKKSSV
ncbi:hypothetical protein Pyn_38435 [Prunus yedoensis var. nudiflora]|uniref:Uncharacterized protein n=1 Tax=Prunus yedoensis var. nudiflora TaxID=2094558 RepID=A0A314YBJ0_PRUYE|nr:hypothetical protein Pyn_38435 [Prunus yedoensis var. nudiflora]